MGQSRVSYHISTLNEYVLMKKFLCTWIASISLVTNVGLVAQEEDELQAARENIEELGDALRHELEEMEEETHHLDEGVEEAREHGEDREVERIEMRMVHVKECMGAWRKLLAHHERLTALNDEALVEQQEAFYSAFRQVNLRRDEGRIKVELQEIELEMAEAREEEDEHHMKYLEHRTERLGRESAGLRKLAEGWEHVAALRKEERFEEAEDKERHLGIVERDLDLAREIQDLNMRQFEANRELDHLRRAMAMTERRAHAAREIVGRQRQVIKAWERVKRSLAEAADEERQTLMEDFEFIHHEFHLHREMTELHLRMSEAEIEGDEEEVGEIREHVEELKEEIRNFHEERNERKDREDAN